MTDWTQEQWSLLFDLLDNGWPGELHEDAAEAYRVMLAEVDPDRVVAGVKMLLYQGARFRPSAAEILSAGRTDPGRPTFAEALRLIFGARGVLAAEPTERRFTDAGQRARCYRQAALDRAAEMHPVIGAFIQRQGLDRLRELPLADPDYGELRRKELEREWDAMLDRFDERQVAADALPAGDRRRGELHAFNPLAVLDAPRRAVLTAGTTIEEEEAEHGDR